MTSHPNWEGLRSGEPPLVETWPRRPANPTPNVWAFLTRTKNTTAILRLFSQWKIDFRFPGFRFLGFEVSWVLGLWIWVSCLGKSPQKMLDLRRVGSMSKEIRGSGESGRWECKWPQVPKSRTAGCWQCLDIICFNVPLIQIYPNKSGRANQERRIKMFSFQRNGKNSQQMPTTRAVDLLSTSQLNWPLATSYFSVPDKPWFCGRSASPEAPKCYP